MSLEELRQQRRQVTLEVEESEGDERKKALSRLKKTEDQINAAELEAERQSEAQVARQERTDQEARERAEKERAELQEQLAQLEDGKKSALRAVEQRTETLVESLREWCRLADQSHNLAGRLGLPTRPRSSRVKLGGWLRWRLAQALPGEFSEATPREYRNLTDGPDE